MQANRHSINNLDLNAVFGGSATDLFDDEIITSGSDSKDADSIISTVSAEPEFHHLNILGYPVYHRSSTPAAVSLWLAFTSQKKQTSLAFSRQGVICAQATKLVDPFFFYGEDATLQLCGTELQNAVVGLVERAYTDQGTWRYDCFSENDEVPRCIEVVQNQHFVFRDQDSTSWLPAPYWASDDDEGVTAVNDGKRFSKLYPTRRCSDVAFEHTPSKLLTEHFEDGTSVEAKPPVLFVPIPAPSSGEEPEPSLPEQPSPVDTHVSPAPHLTESTVISAQPADPTPTQSLGEEPAPSLPSNPPTPHTHISFSLHHPIIIDNLVAEEIEAYKDAFRALKPYLPFASLLSYSPYEGDQSGNYHPPPLSHTMHLLTTN